MKPEDRLRTALSGRYELLAEIGRGGMGVVYRARERGLAREVALKILLGYEHASPQQRARFAREAELTAALRHPGILRVHAAGEAGGVPWIAYEFLRGARTLGEAFGDASLRQRVGWVRDAARALGAAHRQGILHRDVKEENILVDAEGCAKVADFGLAWSEDAARLSKTGTILGTVTHLAPEQATGQRAGAGVGPPADVWALGVVLYRALTDELPFQGGSLPEVLLEVARARFPRPRALRPEAPADLEAVCLRCLRRNPRDRYPHADALADDLERWLAGERPAAAGGRRAARWKRALLALPAAGLLLAGALALKSAEQVQQPPSTARPPAPPPKEKTAPSTPPQEEAVGSEPATRGPAPGGRRAVRRARQALRALFRETSAPAAERLRALSAWLHQNPRHPEALRARKAAAALAFAVPWRRLAVARPPATGTPPTARPGVIVRFLTPQRLLAGARSGRIALWAIATDGPGAPRTWSIPGPLRACVAVDHRTAFLARGSRVVRLDAEGGPRGRWQAPGPVHALAATRRNGATELAVGGLGRIDLVRFEGTRFVASESIHRFEGASPVVTAVWLDGGRRLAAGDRSWEHSLVVLERPAWRPLPLTLAQRNSPPPLSACSLGRDALLGNLTGWVLLLDGRDPRRYRSVPGFVHESSLVAQGLRDRGGVRPAHIGRVVAVASAPAAGPFYSAARPLRPGAGTNELCAWDRSSGSELARVPLPAPPTSLACSPDGRLLAVGLESGEVLLYRVPFARAPLPGAR
ncbi:MAG: serine/threonine protein kinase [Planctomycetota bacterium]|nr:MAG: serine/threonine protein kinase [Planctomycetota bacterium]